MFLYFCSHNSRKSVIYCWKNETISPVCNNAGWHGEHFLPSWCQKWCIAAVVLTYCQCGSCNLQYFATYDPPNIFTHATLVQTRRMTEYSAAKIGEYLRISPNFQNCTCCKQTYLKENKHNSLHLTLKICLDICYALRKLSTAQNR